MLVISHRALQAALIPLVVCGSIAPHTAFAQNAATTAVAATPTNSLPELIDGKRIFTPAYFTADSPQTAADMVGRVPGFSIDNGDSVRGFGGAAGNVLIDGARPTSKDEGLESILSRIPAANVERVELLEGAAAGALAPGKTQVVNVVRKADSKSGGSWELGAEGTENGRILPSVEASYTARLGRLIVTAGLEAEMDDAENLVGFEGFRDPGGTYTESGPNDDRRRRRFGQATLGADGTFGAYKISANGSWYRGAFRRNYVHVATRTGAALPFRLDEGRETNDETNWEIGGDIERNLFGWTGKLALLSKNGDQKGGSLAGFNLIGQPKSFDRFVSEDLTSERVARITFKRKFGSHQIETGGEYAYNDLDTTGIFSQSRNGTFVVLPSNISSTQVQEDRREAFISDSWTVTPKLTVEATWTGEWSTISQSGDAAKERSFFYPKPRLKAVWKPNEQLSLRGEIVREVGQLDFGAFADSASVGDGTQNNGNPELRPEQNWAYRIGVEKRWGKRGVVDFSVVYKKIEDQLTLVPIGRNGVALGNIPEATLQGYALSWTVPLDVLAAGLEFGGSYNWRDTELLDPLTGAVRPFSGNKNNNFEANIRYDMPQRKLKVGAWVYRGEARRDYRPTQLFEWSTVQFWGVWIETKAIKGLTAEFGLEDLGGNTFSRLRTDYVPDRRSNNIARTQYRERNTEGTWYLRIKGTI
jgi:TonB-dependent Receptor Plug Domain/Outer membrane protein beta-barrel family